MCNCSYDFVGQWPIFVWSSSFSFVIIHILILTLVIIIIIITVADPGDGPGGPGYPLIFGPKRGPKGRKKCLETAPPPLSQHLDPPLHHTNQLHQHIVTIIISVLIINLKHSSNPVASPPILFLLEQTLQRTT